MVNIPETSWERDHSLGTWDTSLPPEQYTHEKIGNIIWIPTDIFDMAQKVTSRNYEDFLYRVCILSDEEQDTVMDFLIGEGIVDISVFIYRELDHSYTASQKSLLKWLSLLKRRCSDDILLEYIFLSDDPKSMIRKVAELWYFPLCVILFQKFPNTPCFSGAECLTLFNAYLDKQSQWNDGLFLWGRNWEHVFWTLFEDPEYAHGIFENIFQGFQSSQYKKFDERMEDYRIMYSNLPMSILHKIERKPTTYKDDSQQYLKDILLKVWLPETSSGKIMLVNFHTLDGLVQVFLDTHSKISISYIAPWQFFCHTKESFLETIYDIASQFESKKSGEEVIYRVVVMRENGSRDTHPPAANDEAYAQAA